MFKPIDRNYVGNKAAGTCTTLTGIGQYASEGTKTTGSSISLAGSLHATVTGRSLEKSKGIVSLGSAVAVAAAGHKTAHNDSLITKLCNIFTTGTKKSKVNALLSGLGQVETCALVHKRSSLEIIGISNISVTSFTRISVIIGAIDLQASHSSPKELDANHNLPVYLNAEHNLPIVLNSDHNLPVPLNADHNFFLQMAGGVDVAAENQDFTMYIGDSKQLHFTVNLPENATLHGASITWAMAFLKGIISTKEVASGIEITGADTFIVSLEPVDTATLSGGFYSYEIQITDSAGNVTTAARGRITLKNDLIK